ncbi:CIC11C00000004533 [Sungouiella intermedia]|uniref:CIC11C00000004533 n=1 Tax=Sungouiella intermedia TaxID=45354 RepID=A0A1L0GA34_9ASCO|nr:CIC11C00000004533 [[Candida] intermedia]
MAAKSNQPQTLMLWIFFVPLVYAVTSPAELGSYKNPHPRPYERCEAHDLIKLSECCNDVLAKLDDCKAGDLACECCALQHMDPLCYSLCPGNPSTNFLSVLYNDCAPLNDVNACNLPFKKVDGQKAVGGRKPEEDEEDPNKVSVKSVVLNVEVEDDKGILLYSADAMYDSMAVTNEQSDEADEMLEVKSEKEEAEKSIFKSTKPKVVLVNASNATSTYYCDSGNIISIYFLLTTRFNRAFKLT